MRDFGGSSELSGVKGKLSRWAGVPWIVLGVWICGLWAVQAEGIYSNSWVRPSARNNLLYRHDEMGVRICDFSRCGYKGGAVTLPQVSRLIEQDRWIPVPPADGDDTAQIQEALDRVSQMPLNANGFRGVVQLGPGEYQVGQTTAYIDTSNNSQRAALFIRHGGVVLKGVGSRSVDTKIRATARTQYTLLSVEGPKGPSVVSEHVNHFADRVVPAGTRTFKLLDTTGLEPRDSIRITRPFTLNWISEIDMDKLGYRICLPWPFQHVCVPVSMHENWKSTWHLEFERKITRIEGKWITVDSPLPSTFEPQYGGGFVQHIEWPERLQNVGIEDIYFDTDYASSPLFFRSTDEDHGWTAVRIRNTENAWVRNIIGKHFGFSLVELSVGTRNITVAECEHSDPISKLKGDRRYPFHMEGGDHNLMVDLYSDDARHDFAFGSLVPGPNATVRCQTHESHADCGPHMKWSVGGLYDLIDVDGSWGATKRGLVGINVQNRGRNSTGHGWREPT
jgi:hypothetical protein